MLLCSAVSPSRAFSALIFPMKRSLNALRSWDWLDGMPDGEMSDRLADELAAITGADQHLAARGQIARLLADHYNDLRVTGFSKVEALHLTGNYQTALVLAQSAGLQGKRDS